MGSNSSTFEKSRAEMNVFEALLKARSKFGGKREVILDADDRVLTYDELVLASFALGSALKQSAGSGKSVGVMLPTGAGSIISFFALSAYGRVPAMLNFTSGIRNLRGAIRAGQITHVVTAHKFIELAELGGLVEALQDDVTFISYNPNFADLRDDRMENFLGYFNTLDSEIFYIVDLSLGIYFDDFTI